MALLLSGCGQQGPPAAPWRGAHPDPGGYTFLEQGQLGGVCAISVHYPDDAPSAIGRSGTLFLQRGRFALGAGGGSSPAGTGVVARSGDWRLLSPASDRLTLITSGYRFEYELKSTC